MEKKVIIYSGEKCPNCAKAKSFFQALGIEYEERPIRNPIYKDEVVKMGIMSIPVILIGEDKIIGFDKKETVDSLFKAGLVK